jgi:hypothetical protein
MEYGGTAHNRTVYASPLVGGSGFRSPRSFRFAPFPRHYSATFLQPWSCCAKPLFGLQKRRKQPERYVQFGLFFYRKYIDKMIKWV